MDSARRAVKFYDKNILANATTVGDWVHLLGLAPPFRLMCRITNLGTPPVTISQTMSGDWGIGDPGEAQATIQDSATDLAGPAAQTAAGVSMGANDTSQEPIFIRGRTVTTYGTANGGQKVEMWVVGNRA